MQFRRLCVRGRNLGHTVGSTVGGNNDNLVGNISKGTTEFRREGWMLHLHYRICGHCGQRTKPVVGRHYTGNAALRNFAWVPELRWSNNCRLPFHNTMGGTEVWEEEYAGLPQCLQSNWRAQCCCHPRTRCCCGGPGWRYPAVQSVVSLCALCFCGFHAGD
jgi:hypothetical protein